MFDQEIASSQTVPSTIHPDHLHDSTNSLINDPILFANHDLDREVELSVLHEHKLLGYFYRKYPESQLAKSAWKTNLHRNTLLFNEFQKMRDGLAKKNIQVIALKGISLLTSIYRDDWGQRPISDIDVLVDRQHRKPISHWLFDRGYNLDEENKFYANAHKEVWRKVVAGMDVVIELHFDLYANKKVDGPWLTRKNHLSTTVLEKHHELVYLIAHLAHQHTFLKLFWLYDIDLITRYYQFNWDTVYHLARGLKIQRSVDAVFYALRTHLGNTEVPESQSKLWPRLLSWQQLVHARHRPIHYFLLKHCLKDSLAEALKYDLAWINNRLKED